MKYLGATMIGKSYFLLSLLQAGLAQDWKLHGPREVTAQEGSCAQIPCRYSYPSHVSNQPRIGIWNKEGGSGTSLIAFHSNHHEKESQQFQSRTWLSGDLKNGDCSLIINTIKREDAGSYHFRIEFDKVNSYSYFPRTQLHISDFTDKPTVAPVEIIAGKRVRLNCIFNTTCTGTAPALTWDTPTAVHGSVSNTVTQHGATLTYTSVLALTPSLRDQGQTLTCRLSYPTVSSEQMHILTVQSISSHRWKAGLLGAGIILSVGLSGLFIFKCVKKAKSTGRDQTACQQVSRDTPGKQWDRSRERMGMKQETKTKHSANEHEDPTYENCEIDWALRNQKKKFEEITLNHNIHVHQEDNIYANCNFDEEAMYGNV
ncbi:myeloid cell surface antigen CD33-like [Stegostoma tigrinum]|uniref:myeloid cell surface antigen CD33-like n=1 Tax=Stegostoma tigrinum TaxID=3053191 RepID=UPI002870A6E5|nr:myeloid cell surface antigen CD33-like [Stegostoma tigrinum]